MIKKQCLRDECIAEFTGTFLFVVLGIGCIAGMKLTGAVYGMWEISAIWGIALVLAIYLTAGVSGGHLNPSITIAFAAFSNFSKKKVIPYIIAQMLGAFFAAVVAYSLYSHLFTVKNLDTAAIFATFPNPHISLFQAFMTEFFVTALYIAVVFGLNDDGNGVPRGVLTPLFIGLTTAVIGGAFGPLTGTALNAARDFGPRLFISLAGWGGRAMSGGRAVPYGLVPLVAPVIGGLFGAVFYVKLIGGPLARRKLTLMDNDNK